MSALQSCENQMRSSKYPAYCHLFDTKDNIFGCEESAYYFLSLSSLITEALAGYMANQIKILLISLPCN